MRVRHEAPRPARYLAAVAALGAIPAALIPVAASTLPHLVVALLAGDIDREPW